MAYSPYYPNGWQDGAGGGTPVTAAALNNMEAGIMNLNSRIEGSVSTDLNNTTDNCLQILKWSADTPTAHTPHSEGLTSSGGGIVLSYTLVGWGVQISLTLSDPHIFIRTAGGGTWSGWAAVE